MRDLRNLPARLLPTPAPNERLPSPLELRAIHRELSAHFRRARHLNQIDAALERARDPDNQPIPYRLTEFALSCLNNNT